MFWKKKATRVSTSLNEHIIRGKPWITSQLCENDPHGAMAFVNSPRTEAMTGLGHSNTRTEVLISALNEQYCWFYSLKKEIITKKNKPLINNLPCFILSYSD